MTKKQKKKNKNSDTWTWRILHDFVKKAKVGDEIGFTIGRKHFVLVRDDNKLSVVVRVKLKNKSYDQQKPKENN